MIKKIDGWKGIVSRFKDKLVKMIKDVNGRFDDFVSPKIRHFLHKILLHWGYLLVEDDLLCIFFVHIKINYYF